MGAAVRFTAAARADGLQFGCSSLTSAATPAACGDAIEVPLIHTYVAAPDPVVIPGNVAFSGSSAWNRRLFGGTAPRIASWTVLLAAK
jgi:hypothetical protein